jgi:hypothetical protein
MDRSPLDESTSVPHPHRRLYTALSDWCRAVVSAQIAKPLPVDEVTVLAFPLQLPLGLRSVSWGVSWHAPRLTYASTILFDISCTEPYYSPLSTQWQRAR